MLSRWVVRSEGFSNEPAFRFSLIASHSQRDQQFLVYLCIHHLRSACRLRIAKQRKAFASRNGRQCSWVMRSLGHECPHILPQCCSCSIQMSHSVKIYQTCIGCTQCVRACPTDVLEMVPWDGCKANQIASAPRTEDCVGCKRCESACPTDFLSVRVYLGSETTRSMGLSY